MKHVFKVIFTNGSSSLWVGNSVMALSVQTPLSPLVGHHRRWRTLAREVYLPPTPLPPQFCPSDHIALVKVQYFLRRGRTLRLVFGRVETVRHLKAAGASVLVTSTTVLVTSTAVRPTWRLQRLEPPKGSRLRRANFPCKEKKAASMGFY